MSHFFVGVILPSDTKNIEKAIEAIMLPYKEEGAPDQYLEFNDVENEYRASYETDTTRIVKLASGELISFYDKQCENPNYSLFGSNKEPQYKVPEGATEFEDSVKLLYPTFEKYMEEYGGYQKDPNIGRYGYMHNPNAQWDWYQIGGRWTGELDGYDPKKDINNIESCDLCHGSGKRTDHIARENNMKGCNGCEGRGVRVKWPSVWKTHEGDILPVSKVKKDVEFYALLTPNEGWMAKGEMGWFGMSRNETDKLSWKNQVKKMLKQYKDHIIVGVDCHI